MKVRKTIKRALSMLLCVAMMMTTFDLSALTVRAGEGDMTTISGDNIVLNGDGVNVSGDEIGEGGDNNPSDIISDNDVDDASEDIDEESSISENSISENSISENTISDNSINPLGNSSATITVGGYKITGDSISVDDFELKSVFGSGGDECLLIKTNKDLLIEMADDVESTNKPITVSEDIEEINITIKDINIDYSNGANAFQALIYAPGCKLNLTLDGENVLKSNNMTACPGISTLIIDSLGGDNASLSIGGTGTLVLMNCNYAIYHTELTITGGKYKFVDCNYGSRTPGDLSDYSIEITGGLFNTGDIRYQTIGPRTSSDTYHEKGLPVACDYQVIETEDKDFPYEVVEATSKLRIFDYIISADDGSILKKGKDYYPKNTSNEILIINTEKPITIEMADGVKVTDVPIRTESDTSYFGKTYNVTIKDIAIDLSKTYYYGGAIEVNCSGLNLALDGNNSIIGSHNLYPLRVGNSGWSSTDPTGDLTISGSGTLQMGGGLYAMAYSQLNIISGKIDTTDCTYAFQNNNVNITGGYFTHGDLDQNTVGKGNADKYSKTVGATVANGYMVVESGDEDFPYKVIATPAIITSFDLSESAKTVYLKAGDEYGEDWIDGVGGRSSAFLLLVSNIKDVNENDVSFEDANVRFTSLNPAIAEVTKDGVVHGLSVGTAKIEIKAGYGNETYTQVCTVTVKKGSIDVLQEKWAPVDAEGIPVDFDHFDENGQPVDADEQPVDYEKWGPTGEMMVVNSFGNLVEANEWITNDWSLQYEDWKISPNSEEFWPSNYTVKVYTAQTITESTLKALNYTFDRDGVLENANRSITFDLSGKTWTANTALELEDQMLFTNGIINANKDLKIGYTKTEDTENVTVSIGEGLTVNASNLYVEENTSIIVNGTLTVKGETELYDKVNIIDNGSVTLNNVFVDTNDWDNPGFIGIARYIEAALSINGNVESGGDVFLNVGLISAPVDYRDDDFTNDIIDNEENEGVLKPINSNEDELFKSSLSTFNCEWVRVWQPWSNQGTSFHITYYDKDKKAVYAGEEAFYVENITSQYHYGVGFAQWSDVAAYVASINDADSEYVVNINVGEVEAFANFKFPKAARSIIFRSNYILKDDDGNPIPEVDEEGNPVIDDENNPVYVIGGTLVKYTGDLTLTTDTVFENIDFVRVDSDEKETPYTLTKVEIAGHVLTTRGNVTFNTPVNFTDNKKTGTLRVEGGKLFTALEVDGQQNLENHAITKLIENDYEFEAANGAIIIAGQISNVGNIDIVPGQLMVVTDYMTQTGGKYTFNAPVFTPVNLFVNDGTVIVANENAPYFKTCETTNVFTDDMKTAAGALSTKAKATVTNATIGGYFEADEMQLTNVQLGNWDEIPATIYSKGSFNITGILTSSTGFNTLKTTNDSKGVPYLNVSGTVIVNEDGHKIQVANVDENGDYTIFTGKDKDENGKDTTGSILLQTKTGNIDQFAPYFEDNTHTNLPASCYENVFDPTSYIDCEFSAKNINGYILKKSGNNIYVLKGEDVVVALARGTGYINDDDKDALENAEDNIIGYYSSWGDAVVTINNLKDQNEQYEIIVVRDIGGETAENKPVTLSFPTAACLSMLQVTSIGDAGIYYTNGLTLTSNTKFEDVILAPVKLNAGEYQGTALAINSGAYNLDMNGVDFPTVNGGSCTLASITGNGRNTVRLGDITCDVKSDIVNGLTEDITNIENYNGLAMTGGVTNVGNLYIDSGMTLIVDKGDVKATNLNVDGGTLRLNNGNVTSTDINIFNNGYVRLQKGNIKATNIFADGNNANSDSIYVLSGNIDVTDLYANSVCIYGNLTSKGKVEITRYVYSLKLSCVGLTLFGGAEARIEGSVNVSSLLEMEGDTNLNVKFAPYTITLKDVNLSGENNKIVTCRNGKGESNLKITGKLQGDSLIISEYGETKAKALEAEALNGGGYKVTPTAANMIANIGTIPSEMITYSNEEENDDYVLVKYNGGLYYADSNEEPFSGNFVYLDKETVDEQENIAYYDRSRYLDWNEAVKEINSINDPTAKYRINIGSGVTDTNLTDANQYGTLTLPAANKCNGLTVVGNQIGSTVTFTNTTLKLNSSVEFIGLTLNPVKKNGDQAALSVSLGANRLCLKDTDINGEVKSISGGSETGTSELNLVYTDQYQDDNELLVTGDISKVGNVVLNTANLESHGKINVGNITCVSGNEKLTGVAIVKDTTKKEDGVDNKYITSVASNITIAGTVTGDLKIDLKVEQTIGKEKNYNTALADYLRNGNYVNLPTFIKEANTGVVLAKAVKADTSNIKFVNSSTINPLDSNGITPTYSVPEGMIIKKGGNLVWVNRTFVPYLLQYDGKNVPCLTFADAVTEIKNLNNKNADYTIILRADENGDVNADFPENFTMPTAATLNSLTIKPNPYGVTPVNLYYGTKSGTKLTAVAKLAFASDTTIENVNFIDAEAAANKDNGDYPGRAALNVSLGGKIVTFDNVTFEGRGVIFDGGKGTMAIGDGGLVAGIEPATIKSNYPGCSVVQGEIKNLATLVTAECETFGSGSGETLVITKYKVNGADKAGALATITNLNLNGATVQVEGAATITNISTGDEEVKSVVMADGAFTVSGTVTAGAVDNLALIGRQKNDGKTPQLTISGTVAPDSNPVAIGILPYCDVLKNNDVKSYDPDELLGEVSNDKPLSLLTASKCTADRFVTLTGLTMTGNVADSFETTGFNPNADIDARGYGLVKSGSLIKAYEGSYIHLALVKVAVNSSVATPVPVTGNGVIGYYNTVKEATDAINTRNDKTAQYAIVLLDSITDVTAITIPAATKAAAIGIQGYDSVKNLNLKTLAIANNVAFVKINVTVDGAVTSTKGMELTLNQGATLYGKAAITLENVFNMTGTNKIKFTRTTVGASQLKINGTVRNGVLVNYIPDNPLQIEMVGDGTVTPATMPANKNNVTIGNSNIIFTAPKVLQRDIVIKQNGEDFVLNGDAIVKAKDAFVFVDGALAGNFVSLEKGLYNAQAQNYEPVNMYLDLNQAFLQIKAYADPAAAYDVLLNGDINDTDLLDTINHSKINMPAVNTAGSISVKGDGDTITYSGDITAYVAAGGALTFSDVELDNVNPSTGASVNTGKITLNRNSADKDGIVTLNLNNVAYTGNLGTIAGTKGVTDVYLDSDIELATGFSNINELTIQGDIEVETGKSDTGIGTITFNGNAEYISASTVVDNIIVAANCIPIVYTAGGDKFKVNKYVNAANENAAVVISLASREYENANLVYAPLADASAFKANPFDIEDDETYEKLVSYKSGNYVRVGNIDDMTVRIEGEYETAAGDEMNLSSYAKNYKDAIDMINTWKTKADYTIELRNYDVYATGKDNAYAAFVTPTAANANSVTIKGQSGDNEIGVINRTVIAFTGTIKPTVDVIFEDVALDAGKAVKGVWVSDGGYVSLDLSSASIDMGNAITAAYNEDDDSMNYDDSLFVKTIKGTKGELTLRDTLIYISDVINVGTLKIDGIVNVHSDWSVLKNITIGSVIGIDIDETNDDQLIIDAPIGTSPMLKITGEVTGLDNRYEISMIEDPQNPGEMIPEIDEETGEEISNLADYGLILRPIKKDSSGEVRYLNELELDDLVLEGSENTAQMAKMKIADIAKVPTSCVGVQANGDNYHWSSVTKSGGFIYLTREDNLCVDVDRIIGGEYHSRFISFADAVVDIDKLADKDAEYEINITDNRVGDYDCWSRKAFGAITLPKNAAFVEITGCMDEETGDLYDTSICTTSTSITVNVPTAFNHVQFVSIKQKYNNPAYGYYYEQNPTLMSYNIANNANLDLNGCHMTAGKITGDTLILENGSNVELTGGLTVKDLVLFCSAITTNGKTTITTQNRTLIMEDSSIDAPLANVTLKGTTIGNPFTDQCGGNCINGSNITLTGDTMSYGGTISACGENAAGTGKLSIQNLTIGGVTEFDDGGGDYASNHDINLFAKVDASGKSQINISGTVSRLEGSNARINVNLLTNTSASYTWSMFPVKSGDLIMIAPKFDINDANDWIVLENTGWESIFIKSGNNIVFDHVKDYS